MTLSVQQQYLEHRIVEAREHPLHDADAVGPASELFERGEGPILCSFTIYAPVGNDSRKTTIQGDELAASTTSFT